MRACAELTSKTDLVVHNYTQIKSSYVKGCILVCHMFQWKRSCERTYKMLCLPEKKLSSFSLEVRLLGDNSRTHCPKTSLYCSPCWQAGGVVCAGEVTSIKKKIFIYIYIHSFTTSVHILSMYMALLRQYMCWQCTQLYYVSTCTDNVHSFTSSVHVLTICIALLRQYMYWEWGWHI